MLFLHRPGIVVAYFRLIFNQPMGEGASTFYLQQAAKVGVLGDVDADSIAALQFFPGKPRLTLEEGQARFPGSIVNLTQLKSRNDTMFMFVNIDHVYRTND